MIPEASPNQQGVPVSLPAVSSAQPGATHTSTPVNDAAAHYAAKIKQLVLQYNNDPHHLAEALSQLKAAYLAERHHITPNQVAN